MGDEKRNRESNHKMVCEAGNGRNLEGVFVTRKCETELILINGRNIKDQI